MRLAGGGWVALGGWGRLGVGAANAERAVAARFKPGADDTVFSLAVQADGKILVGGFFNTLGGQSRNYIGRLDAAGPPAPSLNSGGATLIWARGGTRPEV